MSLTQSWIFQLLVLLLLNLKYTGNTWAFILVLYCSYYNLWFISGTLLDFRL